MQYLSVFGFFLLVFEVSSKRYDVHDDIKAVNDHVHPKAYSVGVLPEEKPPYALVFICGTFFLATLIRLLWTRTRVRLPYVVVMFSVGALIGWLAYQYSAVHDYTEGICDMSPKYLLMIFLPVLIFRTAYCIDAYVFKRHILQILAASVVGFVIAMFLTAILTKSLYFNEWSWELAIMFAAVSCTSYPQDILILLKEQGQFRLMSIIFEGEGLLVDGLAIVVFNILLGYVTGYVTDGLHIWILCLMFLAGGPVLGYIVGKLTACALNQIFNDVISTATTTLVIAYVSYYIAEQIIGFSGVLCIVVLGMVLSAERISLSSEVDKIVVHFWEILSFFASSLIFMMVGVLIFEAISGHIAVYDVITACVLYLICFLSRILTFVSVNAIFKFSRSRYPNKNLAIFIWGHLRGAVSLCLALVVYKAEGMEREGYKFLIYVSTLVLLSQVINGCSFLYIMRALGLTKVSILKKANMNRAIRYLIISRDRSLNMVKMDRHLAGANWAIVQEATKIINPYKPTAQEGEETFTDYPEFRITFCPDCLKEIPTQPSKQEYREMLQEANLRILKAKKVSYRRQYKCGLLSKEVLNSLVTAVEIASDRENPVMEVNDLQGYWTRQIILDHIRRCLINCAIQTDLHPSRPQGRCRLFCYKLATSTWVENFMLCVIVINVVTIIIELALNLDASTDMSAVLTIFILSDIYFILFFIEIVVKMMGLRIKYCLTSIITVLDLVVLTISVMDIFNRCYRLYHIINNIPYDIDVWETVIKVFPMLRLLRFLMLCKRCVPRIIEMLDSYLDEQLKRSYEVGKGFVTAEEEILKMLIHIVDYKPIYYEVKEKIDDDRLAVSKRLGVIQKDYPEIAVHAKTKQAIRTIINKIQDAVKELNDSGLLDDFEYSKCLVITENNLNYLRTLRNIEPCSPIVLLKEIPWVAGDNTLEKFLIEKTRAVHFNSGQVIIAHGSIPEFLYVILYGVVKLLYIPTDQTLKNLQTFGALPNCDYFTTLQFEDRQEELLLPGNVIGELGILTERMYDVTASCETTVGVFEISLIDMWDAINNSTEPSTGLKSRMWKVVALRIAFVILTNSPQYQSWTQEDIKFLLERGFVPTLSQSSIFTVSEMIEDILLIEGQVMDANTKHIFKAPCHIPRTTQTLIFPHNKLMAIDTEIDTKLLIIPVKHGDQVEVIKGGQGVRITSSFSAKCLHHSVHEGLSEPKFHKERKELGKTEIVSTRSVPNIPKTKSFVYGLYNSSIDLSRNFRNFEESRSSQSLKSLFSDYEMKGSDSKRSEGKSQQVLFNNRLKILQSDSFSDSFPILQFPQGNGSPDSEELIAVYSMSSKSSESSHSSAEKITLEPSQSLKLPFKRVFMSDILEQDEER